MKTLGEASKTLSVASCGKRETRLYQVRDMKINTIFRTTIYVTLGMKMKKSPTIDERGLFALTDCCKEFVSDY